MKEPSGRWIPWIRHGIVVVTLLAGGAVTAACNLVAGVDELQAGGPCDEQGAPGCDGNRNMPQVCGANGHWQDVPGGACVNQTCDEETGKCGGACAPLEKQCADKTPQACADGQWKPSGAACSFVCAGGQCTGVCLPGQTQCVGNTSQLCDAGGQWHDDVACEEKGQTCNEETGQCGGVCAPGPAQCSPDNQRRRCDASGQWQEEEDCSKKSQTCNAAECVGICEPGKRCGGNTPQICDADGLWTVSGPACEGDKHCNAGACVETCSMGDLRCAGNFPQKCDDEGAWKNDGPVCPVCFGCNPNTGVCNPTPEPVCTKPTAIAVGSDHTCALLPGDSVKCWGNNYAGQLGLGDKQPRGDGPNEMGALLPQVDLGPGETATALTAGNAHTCALLQGGGVKCWGNNYAGQLGLGDEQPRGDGPNEMGAQLPKVDLGPGETATMITAGNAHTCALLAGGSVKCWGANDFGQLGLGDQQERGDEPNEMGAQLPKVDLGPGETATALTAGRYHTCALLAGGGVKCWGANDFGQLGLGNTQPRGDGPNEMGALLPKVDLGPGETATALTVGANHTCALLAGDSVKCWGDNGTGQLGLGNTQDRGDSPNEMGAMLPKVDLGPGETAPAISAGGAHTCALLSGGSVKCWGNSDYGQLGLGDTQRRGDEPNEMGDNLPPVDL